MNSKKKIIHLSESDLSGGASFYAFRVFKYLNSKKLPTKMYVFTKISNNKNVIQFKSKKSNFLKKKLFFFFLTKNNKYSFYNYGNYSIFQTSQINKLLKEKPKALIIYNNDNLIHPRLIKFISDHGIKVFFYLMDYELITGGCHYTYNCNNYKIYCTNCPATKLILKNLPNKIFLEKLKYYKDTKITFLTETDYHAKEVAESKIFNEKKHKIFKIPLSADLKFYKPNQTFKKKKRLIISFRSSLNPRKGNSILIDAIEYLYKMKPEVFEKIIFNIVGDSEILKILEDKKIKYLFKNKINNEKDLIKFYQNSDFFLCQSIQDLGPMMVAEAMACGLPIISFKEGVSREVLKNKENGFIVKKISSKYLANAISKAANINGVKLIKMKKNARKTAKENFDIQKNLKPIFENL